MAKLTSKIKRRNETRGGKRFYTALDMAVIKHDDAVENSREKRGEIKRFGNRRHSVCGCGVEGCFVHVNYESDSVRKQREQDAYNKKWGIVIETKKEQQKREEAEYKRRFGK